MKEQILSVGIDLGTTTTQMIVSRLQVENTAASYAVPRMEISQREILYKSDVYFTPLLSPDTLDGAAIQLIIRQEYAKAGIKPSQVQTGAVIITGETARKENAREVLRVLSDLAGDFVVATAGPALESVLAAKGAGADSYAQQHGVPVLHFDIGGGTSNLAFFNADGQLVDTGCLNVGGRLMKFDREGIVTYVSPVLNALDVPQIGSKVSEHDLETLMKVLVQALEEAAGLRPKTQCLQQFVTDKTVALSGKTPVISFSGGVADLIDAPQTDWLEYGDLGVLLGRAIRASKLCKTSYTLGRETLRATVAGAGTYSTELSGSTIYYNNVSFPLQNLPVVALLETDLSADCIKAKTAMYEDGCTAVALRGKNAPTYEEILLLADLLAESLGARSNPLVAVLEADMAKALGQALRCRLGPEKEIVCLDGLHIPEGSYLDIGAPVAGGAAIPVVIKTLAFI